MPTYRFWRVWSKGRRKPHLVKYNDGDLGIVGDKSLCGATLPEDARDSRRVKSPELIVDPSNEDCQKCRTVCGHYKPPEPHWFLKLVKVLPALDALGFSVDQKRQYFEMAFRYKAEVERNASRTPEDSAER